MKILNSDFIIALVNQVFLAFFYYSDHVSIERGLFVVNEVFEKLEEEGTVETVTITS